MKHLYSLPLYLLVASSALYAADDQNLKEFYRYYADEGPETASNASKAQAKEFIEHNLHVTTDTFTLETIIDGKDGFKNFSLTADKEHIIPYNDNEKLLFIAPQTIREQSVLYAMDAYDYGIIGFCRDEKNKTAFCSPKKSDSTEIVGKLTFKSFYLIPMSRVLPVNQVPQAAAQLKKILEFSLGNTSLVELNVISFTNTFPLKNQETKEEVLMVVPTLRMKEVGIFEGFAVRRNTEMPNTFDVYQIQFPATTLQFDKEKGYVPQWSSLLHHKKLESDVNLHQGALCDELTALNKAIIAEYDKLEAQ